MDGDVDGNRGGERVSAGVGVVGRCRERGLDRYHERYHERCRKRCLGWCWEKFWVEFVVVTLVVTSNFYRFAGNFIFNYCLR